MFFFVAKLHQEYDQCVYIVKAKSQIAPSKAVVGVNQPVHSLSKHKLNSYIICHLDLQGKITQIELPLAIILYYTYLSSRCKYGCNV